MDSQKTWLITGASGLLGHALCNHLTVAGAKVVGVGLTHPIGIPGVENITLDLGSKEDVQALFSDILPDYVVHAAGLTNVDSCEKNPALAHRIHVLASQTVAEAATRSNAKLAYISTDHLWSGAQAFTSETTTPDPVNVYAKTKYEGEVRSVEANPETLVVRTNFFGIGRPWRQSLSDWIGAALNNGQELRLFDDAYFTPIALDHLCPMLMELLQRDATGIFNLCGSERLSKYEFGIQLAEQFGLSTELIVRSKLADFDFAAPRPADMSLSTDKISAYLGHPMPTVAKGLNTLIDAKSPATSVGCAAVDGK